MRICSLDPRDRGSTVAQVGGQEELEEVLFRTQAERALPRHQAGRKGGFRQVRLNYQKIPLDILNVTF